MDTPRRIAGLFLLMLLGVYGFVYFSQLHDKGKKESRLAAMLSYANPVPAMGERVRESNCVLNGPLPDPECTPGSVFKHATAEEICVSGYSKTVRNVSLKLRKQVFAEYGISYPQPTGSYELDHLIPLALGGDNSIANLFPEAAEPKPGFKEKDVVEIFLHDQVCRGQADLAAAQRHIAHDWLAIYNNLTDEQIQAIRAEYRNWSN